MGNRAANPPMIAPRVAAAVVCGLVGMVLFQFFGNATRGYVDTPSMFWWWVSQWLDRGAETEHGWIVLAVSVGLFAWRLKASREVEESKSREESSDSGFSTLRLLDSSTAAILLGLALHLVGFAAQQTRVSIVAFLIFTWGVLRLGGGKKWGATAAFPLAFMVFSIPVNVLDSFGFWLQMGVVRATAAIAHVTGIEVVRNGTQLFAPDGRYQYDVVAACSGVRSLVALTALSVLAGYLSFRGWGRRAIVLLLCFPLVYLGNVARLTAIVVAAQIGGQRWGDIAHEAMGIGVFAIVLGGVMAAVVILERWWPEGRDEQPARPSSEAPLTINTTDGRAARPYLVAGVVIVLAVSEMIFLQRLANSPDRGGAGIVLAADGINPVELPAFIGTEWVGRRTEITAIEREILPPDTGFSRKVYVPLANPTKQVLLSLVLSGRDRTSIHRPELCLVGQGWTIEGKTTARFRSEAEQEFPATVLRVRREIMTPRGKTVVPQLVAYWFVSTDRIVATHWARVMWDGWNRVAHARADRWAYALMQTDAADGETAALARMQIVLEGTMPVFQR